jgi:predicted nucleic acid-binding protein
MPPPSTPAALAQSERLTTAFAFDDDFRTAGFGLLH